MKEGQDLPPGLKKIVEIAEEIKQISNEKNCQNCEYKRFYTRFKEIADYVDSEAEKRIKKMIEEGKIRTKS